MPPCPGGRRPPSPQRGEGRGEGDSAPSCAPKKIFERTEGLTIQSWPNPSSGVAGAPVTIHPLTLSPRTSGPCSSRGEAVGWRIRTRCAGASRTEPWDTGISGIKRGRPYGDDEWARQTVQALLQSAAFSLGSAEPRPPGITQDRLA